MSRLVLLDAGPLGLVTNPKGGDEARRCKAWLDGLAVAGVLVLVPEGADYEGDASCSGPAAVAASTGWTSSAVAPASYPSQRRSGGARRSYGPVPGTRATRPPTTPRSTVT